MIKDVMVRVDGTAADDAVLATAAMVAELFEGYLIALFLNLLPLRMPAEGVESSATRAVEMIDRARDNGDRIEQALSERLARLPRPSEVRRFDLFPAEIVDAAIHQARSADTFITARPNAEHAPPDAQGVAEGVLFGSGRHVLLVPGSEAARDRFDRVMIAWNASRESVRALAEAMPYLRKAKAVVVVAVDEDSLTGWALAGKSVVAHLKHHGVDASLHQITSRGGDIASTLIEEANHISADLLVMGGYGHSRLREWLLGGVTYHLLRHGPVPLLIAH